MRRRILSDHARATHRTRGRLAVELIVISATEQASPSCRPHHVRRPRKPQSACTGSTATCTATTSSGAAAAAYTDTVEGIDAVVYVVAENETRLTASTRATPCGGPRRAGHQPASTRPRRSRSRAPRSRKRTRSRSARERLLPAWSTPLLPLAWATRQPPRRSHSRHASCPKGCPRSACGAARPPCWRLAPDRAVG